MKPQTIIRLEAENVKGIRAIEITPDGGPVVVVGGENEAGKSSVLDSIAYALAGKGALPSRPIRDGEEKAHVILETEEIVVTRRFTEKGTSLVVTGKDGAKFTSPQTMLDKLTGALSFDPLDFARQKASVQMATLKNLVGLDFADLDEQRGSIYAQRTVTNGNARSFKAQLEATLFNEGVPDKEVSLSELIAERDRCQAHNAIIGKLERTIKQEEDEVARQKIRMGLLKAELQTATSKVDAAVARRRQAVGSVDVMGKLMDTDAITAKIESAEGTNRKVRENGQYRALGAQYVATGKEADDMTGQIQDIDDKKATMLAEADFPVEGLGLGENGVEIKGVPLDQCSGAQRLKLSVAMGLAMNPTLRVLLIRDGSFLGDNNLATISEMASEAGAQIWIERVGEDDNVTVIIEDGCVKQGEES